MMDVDHNNKNIESSENETNESAVSTVDIEVQNKINMGCGETGDRAKKDFNHSEQTDTVVLKNTNTECIVANLNITKSNGENLDEIKRFLDNQDTQKDDYSKKDEHDINTTEKVEKISDKELCNVLKTEASSVASNVMDMILSGAEASINKLKDNKVSKPLLTSPDRGNNSNALSVGTKVEAKDYEELWHPAEITEVDFEEMEVLVHYDSPLKKPDEWISVSSSRLRPFGSKPRPPPTAAPAAAAMAPPAAGAAPTDEPKDDKPKVVFAEGERCLARWRDNRRFIATVKTDLGDGNFEVVFDDGVTWKCSATRLSKLKDSSIKCEPADLPSGSQVTSPAALPGSAAPPQPPYHTHLFDPARDYLGSKSERRALKRKLNIKEIFNIGQKKIKKEYVPKERVPRSAPVKKPVEKKSKVVKKKVEIKEDVKSEVQSDIPDAVASIIGTVVKDETPSTIPEDVVKEQSEVKSEADSMESCADQMSVKEEIDIEENDPNMMALSDIVETKTLEPVDEEQILENFESASDNKHEEVIDKIKEVIKKMEDGLNEQLPESPKPVKELAEVKAEPAAASSAPAEKRKCKWKKSKKLRALQERRVKRQVQRVRLELEEMKRQVEAMRREMMAGGEAGGLASGPASGPAGGAAGGPAGGAAGGAAGGPAGGAAGDGSDMCLLHGEWACRWRDGQPVGVVSELPADQARPNTLPRRSVHVEDKRLPEGWTKHMVRRSCGSSAGKWDVVLINPENQRFHTRAEMRQYLERRPALAPHSAALLDFGVHLKLARRLGWVLEGAGQAGGEGGAAEARAAPPSDHSPLVKRRPLAHKRPAKKKRRHIKRYYEDKFESSLEQYEEPVAEDEPLVAEEGYAYVGSLKVQVVDNLLRCPAEGCSKKFRNKTLLKMHVKHYHREQRRLLGAAPRVLDLVYQRRDHRALKVKITRPKPQKVPVVELAKMELLPPREPAPAPPESPQPRSELAGPPPVKRPKVLLPVRASSTSASEEALDYEAAISTHTVTRPAPSPRAASPPDSDSEDERKQPNMYMYDEFGRRIKLVHMRREEIINCACGFREEDGLMVQCELCLCWQHGACHNILGEQDVPEKYTCSICLNPRRGRRSVRHAHEQDHLYYGALPAARAPCHSLRRAHELAANLLHIQDALHALALKYYVLCKKNHPKLYLWAKDWETTEISLTQEKLNSDYSDLNIMINDIGKENLPLKSEDNLSLGIKTPPPEDQEARWLSGAGCSPGSLELPLSSADLDRLAQAVAEQEAVRAPQPEAAIENGACVARLLRHIQRGQASVEQRLTSIEAQVAELESQDPSFEDDETAEYFPRTKQTIQMLLRDLDTMQELGLTSQCT